MTPSGKDSHTDSYKIRKAAQLAGVNKETIRYYERRNLIPEPEKSCNEHLLLGYPDPGGYGSPASFYLFDLSRNWNINLKSLVLPDALNQPYNSQNDQND